MNSDEGDVKVVLGEFVEAFNDMERDRFLGYFTSDVSVFMAYTPVATRTSVAGAFRALFERARLLPGPPYLNISPDDLSIEANEGLAVATFHLRNLISRPTGEIGRRTAVLRKEHDAWKICHRHVSAQMESSS